MNKSLRRYLRRGFSLTEVVIAVFVFAILMSVFFTSTEQFSKLESAAHVRHDVLATLQRTLNQVRSELARSGFMTLGGVDYPFFVIDGGDPAEVGPHAHAAPVPAPGEAVTGRDVVFLSPIDADGDDWPDLADPKTPVWGFDEISFVLVPAGDGTNQVERRVNGVRTQVLARGVVQFLIEDAAATGFAISGDSLRVRMTLRRTDRHGNVSTERVEEIVTLNN